jgi:hypothetical protein
MMKEWRAQKVYGYWRVYEYRPQEGSGTYGHIGTFSSEKTAREVAQALNEAYRSNPERKRIGYQLRSGEIGLRYANSLGEALQIAESDPTIWEISFNSDTEERVRLLRRDDAWVLDL